MRKITKTMLRRAGACTEQLNLFIELFPNGVVPTREVCLGVADKFNWDWAAHYLLPDAALRTYWEAHAAALRTYVEARAATGRAHAEARAAALRTYDEALAVAWRAYDEARAAALRTYDEAHAAAFADAWASV